MIQDILIWNTSMYQEMSYPLRLEPLRMFNFLNLSLLNINPYKVLKYIDKFNIYVHCLYFSILYSILFLCLV